MPALDITAKNDKIVIIGAGCAGLERALRLRGAGREVMRIDRNNYFTYVKALRLIIRKEPAVLPGK